MLGSLGLIPTLDPISGDLCTENSLALLPEWEEQFQSGTDT